MTRHDAGPLVALALLAACVVLVGVAFARPTVANMAAVRMPQEAAQGGAMWHPGHIGAPAVPASGPALARMPDGTAWTLTGPWSGAYDAWRATAPRRVALRGELYGALLAERVPALDAMTLATAVVTCEAPFYDRIMTRDGWQPDGRVVIGADLRMEGDHDAQGRPLAHGWPQAREEWHGPLLLRHDVYSIDGGAAIVAAIREEAIRIGWSPLRPWSCVR